MTTRRRLGLLIAVAAAIDIPAHVLYLARSALQSRIGEPALRFASAADLLTVASVLGIAAGTIAFLAVPRLLTVARALQLIGRLRPL